MKKILIVSPYFAPENSVASIRFTKIAKYLQRAGHDVTVLCTQMNANLEIDKTLEKELPFLKKVVRIRYPEFLYYKVKSRIGVESSQGKGDAASKTKAGSPGESFREMLVWTYANFCSYLLGRRFLRYLRKKGESYDAVISTYTPLSGHLVGHYMKKKGLCARWIADFRDPMSLLCGSTLANRLMIRPVSRWIRSADSVTTVSQGYAEMLIRETAQFGVPIQDKIHIIRNGYDSEDAEAVAGCRPQKGKLVFSYCGTFYKIGGTIKNDISPLFAALSALLARGKIRRENIELVYAGYDTNTLQDIASAFSMEDIVRSVGRVGREESLRIQKESDVILIPVWNNRGEGGIFPGKFLETLLVQRNVLCIVRGNQEGSELSSVIKELDCGFAYEEIEGKQANPESLENWLECRYQEKLRDGEIAYHADALAKRYSHPVLAEQFVTLMG